MSDIDEAHKRVLARYKKNGGPVYTKSSEAQDYVLKERAGIFAHKINIKSRIPDELIHMDPGIDGVAKHKAIRAFKDKDYTLKMDFSVVLARLELI